LKNSACGSNDKPRDIVKDFYIGLNDEETATSRNRDALGQIVRRERKKKLGDEIVTSPFQYVNSTAGLK
jgi:hypothetical protein